MDIQLNPVFVSYYISGVQHMDDDSQILRIRWSFSCMSSTVITDSCFGCLTKIFFANLHLE